jgi:cell division protein FtsL
LLLISKYKLHFAVFFLSLTALVINSQIHYKIDNEIIQLNQEKNNLIVENLQLKRDIAKLSSPERIFEIATKQLQMKPMGYEDVEFIDVNSPKATTQKEYSQKEAEDMIKEIILQNANK